MILGVDPGSRVTGYGVLLPQAKHMEVIDYGIFSLKGDMPQRLAQLQRQLTTLCQAHPIQAIALEQSFVHLNIAAALKLGQVRGVVMALSAQLALAFHEYAPRQIKQAVVGTGAATKAQVQHMVTQLLSLKEVPSHDAADALALAITHCHWPSAFATPRRRARRGRSTSRQLWTQYDRTSKR